MFTGFPVARCPPGKRKSARRGHLGTQHRQQGPGRSLIRLVVDGGVAHGRALRSDRGPRLDRLARLRDANLRLGETGQERLGSALPSEPAEALLGGAPLAVVHGEAHRNVRIAERAIECDPEVAKETLLCGALCIRIERIEHARQWQAVAFEESHELAEPPRIGRAQVLLDRGP